MPTRYEIRVRGGLDATATEAFVGLTIARDGTATVISGEFDQAALHGVLERIRALELDLIEVRRTRAGAMRGRP